jgi:pimeloyl-ACP methyl ester carboxylesterase
MIDKQKDTKLILAGMPFSHRHVQAAGLRFHLVEGGSGPVVALLAGFPQSWYAWRRVLPLLAERFTVVAIDLPGQGDSEKPQASSPARGAKHHGFKEHRRGFGWL